MMIEGRGQAAPKPKQIAISDDEMRMLIRLAQERAAYRNYSSGRSQWKRGLSDGTFTHRGITVAGADFSCLAGLVGEYGYCRFLGCELDTTLRPRGDGDIDLTYRGMTLQVKTRSRHRTNSLVRRVDYKKRLIAFRNDIFAFAEWLRDMRVLILGWMETTKAISTASFRRGYVGKHWNIEIPDSCLITVFRLKDMEGRQ